MGREERLILELAGLRVELRGERPQQLGVLSDYRSRSLTADHVYTLELCDGLEPPTGEPIYRAADQWVFRRSGGPERYLGPVERGPEGAHIRIRREGSDARITYRRTGELRAVTPKLLLNALELPHLLTIHEGFLLHAAFIEHGGRAILFTAPSETGKSTQARLWCDHAGAELVNGDRAAVRIMDGEVFACGVPISGSSPVRRNVTLPLAAIVYLSQAPENSITRLRGVRAFRRVWEGCTVNIWDRTDVEKATKTVSEAVSRIPVYHLACTPDVRAVELLKHTMEVEK